MRAFDLIPSDFHRAVARRAAMTRSVVSVAVLAGIVVTLWGTLRHLNNVDSERVAERQQLEQQYAATGRLIENQRAVVQRLAMQQRSLESLRGGRTLADAVTVVDGVLANADIWFKDWRLLRLDDDTPRQFVMTLTGSAADHATLSAFLSRLAQHSDVGEVRLERTQATQSENESIVDFEMSVAIRVEGAAG